MYSPIDSPEIARNTGTHTIKMGKEIIVIVNEETGVLT